MLGLSVSNGRPVDLGLCVLATVAAVVVTLVPVPRLVSVAIGVPFLLFVPGYAVTVALFPRVIQRGTSLNSDGWNGLPLFTRAVLSVATSVALAIIVGVNLEFTRWAIRAPTVVGGLAVVTLVAATAGAVRRSKIDRDGPAETGAGSFLSRDMSSLATVMVLLAIGISLVSVAMVVGMGERGEQYTEFALLTESDSGEAVATDFPSNMTVGEETAFRYVITNKEQQHSSYYVVVRLERVGSDGSVNSAERLANFSEELAAGESVRQEHTIKPTLRGADLRLRYLLYRSQPPEQVRSNNAYRDLHIWIDVTAPPTQADDGSTDEQATDNEVVVRNDGAVGESNSTSVQGVNIASIGTGVVAGR